MIEDVLTAPVPAWIVLLIVATEAVLQVMNGTLGRSNSVAKGKDAEKEG